MESSIIAVESSKVEDHVLPEDIVQNILLCLPVKSLFRFRCASKSWFYLIACKRFIRTHLENSKKNPTLAHHRILLKSPYGGPSTVDNRLMHCSLPYLMDGSNPRTYAIEDPFKRTWEFPHIIVGCCDGLISILGGAKEFFLWNPSTRLLNKLPDIKLKGGTLFRSGFGCDARNGDYKVLAVMKIRTQLGNKKEGRIYSLKNNSWTEITMPKMEGITHWHNGIFVNGKLHWLRLRYSEIKWEVDSFDLESEQHGIVQLPRSMACVVWPALVEVKGCLGMHSLNESSGRTDVWVMEQYGVQESWIKVWTIISSDSFANLSLEVIYMVLYGTEFVVCNAEGCVFRHCPYINYWPHVYVESLVSPFPAVNATRFRKRTKH